ncbi:MAG: AmmeMemoRadiSam system protein B [Patescibacteria group bacterium]|nr:AmmeMemoRadiSam system protein B [Patescibacteria group bacterium]MDD4304251.1 AmmeMemoRadiSam system protein B [Patescibacteria group bacterium]MDD4695305.1 AmmeMemoRadiSam system protein B [Patescibacteria group bacterium]
MSKIKKIIFILLTLFVVQTGLIFILSKNVSSIDLTKTFKNIDNFDLEKHYSYFMNKDFFDEAYNNAKDQTKNPETKVYGGIIPHHLIVKDKIASFFEGIKNENYKTIILVGPNHFDNGKNNIIASNAMWITPYGNIEPDSKLIKKLNLEISESPFDSEHSISGLVSFIKYSFPNTKIVPIIVKLGTTEEELTQLATTITNSVNIDEVLFISSIDFSHYQSSNTANFHDTRSNSIISSFDFDRIYQMEIDSPPSAYLLLKYLELNKLQKSELLFSTDSGTLIGKKYVETTSHNIFYFMRGEKLNNNVLNFLFFGDVMLDRNVKTKIKNSDLDYILKDFSGGEENRFFKGLDFVSLNLEGAVTDNGNHYSPTVAYDFAFDPNLVNKLHDYNFNFFNISNNHITDQGRIGLEETYKNLDKLNFNYSGCPDKEATNCSKIINIGNCKIGTAGFSMVYGTFDSAKAIEEIKNLKSNSDIVIVNVHWGTEYTHINSALQQQIAHSFIDNGADMIIGHHPHVVQGMEIYKNKPIFYSLGNFIFDQYFSYDTQEGLSVGISIDLKNLDDYKIYLFPFISNANKLRHMNESEINKFFDKFIDWSDLENKYKEQINI